MSDQNEVKEVVQDLRKKVIAAGEEQFTDADALEVIEALREFLQNKESV